jgi:WD40 repeat protein
LTLWPFAEKDRKRLTESTFPFTQQPLLAGAVSPDGSLLALSGESKSIYIYNRAEEKLAAELTGHDDVVSSLAFSPDGTRLASASYDKTIKLWSTSTWKEEQTLTGHKGWVFGLSFSPYGQILVTGSYDKTLRIWDVKSGDEKAQLNGHTAGIRSVAFSPDGKKVVSGGSDRNARIWDVGEGKVLLILKGHKQVVRSVAFSPDGKSVVTGSEDRTVKQWDSETGKEMNSFPELPDMVTAIAFTPKGQTIAAGTFQGSIALLDPMTGRMRQLFRAHTDSISALVFTDRGQRLFSMSQDKSVRQWTILKTPLVPPIQAIAGNKIGPVTAAAGTRDGKYVVVGGSKGSIHIWDITSGALSPHPAKQPSGVSHIAVTEGMDIASIGKDGSLLVSNREGTELWKGKGSFAAFSPDGKHLAVAEGRDIVVREPATGKEEVRLVGGHDGEVIRLDFSPDGKLLASAGEDTKVQLWNVSSGEKLQETPAFGNGSRITQLAFSPDSTRFAVSAHGPNQSPPDDMSGKFRVVRDVRVYTVPQAGSPFGQSIVFSPQPIDQPITAFLWDRTGQLLAMPASDGTVRYNDFLSNNSSRETKRFRAHDGAVLTAVAMGDSFVTAGEDLVLRKWNLP